jgi:hypothetical protein
MLTPTLIDLGLVATANVFNILVIGTFIARTLGCRKTEWVIGLIVVLLALPCAAGIVANLAGGRAWWTIVLPFLLLSYCILEAVLDYVWKVEFRNTRFLWVYLVVFYCGAIAMIGYGFGVGKPFGYATLGTYLCGLAAAWYSYSRVGHG